MTAHLLFRYHMHELDGVDTALFAVDGRYHARMTIGNVTASMPMPENFLTLPLEERLVACSRAAHELANRILQPPKRPAAKDFAA